MRFDPAPLLITQPKQVAAHLSAPRIILEGNQQLIQSSRLLLGSDPSGTGAAADEAEKLPGTIRIEPGSFAVVPTKGFSAVRFQRPSS
jgi:hypothetical protein